MGLGNPLMSRANDVLNKEFGVPARETIKVTAWDVRPDLGIVLQIDQPKRELGAFIWVPYPPDGQSIPEIALEYPGEAGRHSNTYPSPGLRRGLPALKLVVKGESELADTVTYIKALRDSAPVPGVTQRSIEKDIPVPVDVASMPR